MEFRWIALIALWTLLSGPAFNMSRVDPRPAAKTASANAGGQPAKLAVKSRP
jgi:hypothetical protein